MPTLNTRENFDRLIRKQIPEYIPTYNLFWALYSPECFNEGLGPNRAGTDYFGVEWTVGDGTAFGGALPAPGKFILDDITKWRDVIKVPDFASRDWAAMAKKALDQRDPTMPFGGMTIPSVGFFQALMSFMGFDEGLMACFEEPEEVKALMDYLCDWSCDLAKLFIQHYQPDFGFMCDDIAHERNPFLSVEMFQDLFAPYWRRYYAVFLEADLPVGMHNCGHFEAYLDDLTDMGCTFWDPVQTSNDAVAIKAKYGNSMALCMGGPDMSALADDAGEEEVRAYYRAYIDKLAPGGGFALMQMGNPDAMPPEMLANFSETQLNRMRWTADEFEKIRYSYY